MKKHGFRSIFSLLLAVMMVCSMLPTAAFAEGDVEEQSVVVDPVGTPAGEPKQDEVKPPEGETPEEPKQPEGETPEEPKQPEGETSQGPARPADAAPSDAGVPGSNRLTVSPMPNPDPTPAALNTGHKIDVTFTVLYVGDEFKIGYNYGSSEKTKFVCQYTSNHSDTAYNNHTIAISDIKAAAGRASVNSGYQIVGWSKEANANPTTWSLNKSGTTACNKGTTIYLVAKNPNPTTERTFILKFDVNGGTGTFADVTRQSSAQYEMLQIPSNYVPTREGHTFKGWKDTYWDSTYQVGASVNVNRTDAACTVTDTSCTKTLCAVWEKNAPNGPTSGKVAELLGQVKVHCTTPIAGHEDQTYDLYYALSSMVMAPDGSGYTCDVRVEADEYVTKYNKKDYPGTDHVLADGENRIRSFVLRNDNDGKGWYISEGENLLPIVFNVKCEAPTPPSVPNDKEIERALSDRVNVVVSCVTANSGHPSKTYPLFAYVSGLTKPNPNEVTANSDGTYSYTVSFLASNFVKMYSGAAPFGIESDHELADAQDLRTVTLTLRDITVGWTATAQDIKVSAKCEEQQPQPDKPTAPDERTVMAALKGAVKITCTTPNSGHAPQIYDLMSGFTAGTVQGDANTGYTYTISVDAGSYVWRYNNPQGGTGVNHTLDDTSPKPITLKWNGAAWVAETNLPINFDVKCEAENPPVDIGKPTFDELKALLSVKVECTNGSATHEPKFDLYELKNKDEDSKFAIGEVNQSGDVPTCTVTIGSKPYVAAFDNTTGKTHEQADTTRTVDLVYNKETGKWALKNADDATVVFQVACTTEEPEVPGVITDEDLAKLKVVIHCTTNGSHTDRTYDLIAGNYSLDYSDEGFTCYIDVPAAPYVNKYISDTGPNHELVDPQKSSKTITLRWNTETKEWAADSNSVTFDVKCKPDAPKAEDLLSVVIHCKSDVHNDGLYDLKDGNFTVGEVEGNEADGYTCKVTVEAAQYVNKYIGEMGANHDVVGEDIKTVKLKYESAFERWTVDSTVVTFDVECIPAPNISMLQVQVHCVTPNSSHMDEFYDLPEDTTLEYVDANTRKITVQAAPYVERYGNGHELADGESESKAITATWNGVKWDFNATSVTFDVKCETQPEVPGDITDEDLAKLKVVIHCTTNGSHTDRTYDLIAGTYRRDDSNDGGFTCYIAVLAAPYVNEYISDTGTNHELVDPQKSSKTITLRWNTETKAWAADSNSVTFDVTCENVPAQKYTVTYTDGVDGVEIFKDQVYADLTAGTATPAFNGTPTRVGYFFAGWNPAVDATVTGNVTYAATWKVDSNNNGKPDDEEERYTVTYLDGANGRAFASQVYPGLLSGTATPKFNGTPARSGYVFIGWSPVWSGTVTGNVTYTATWSTITGGLDKVPKTGDNGLTLALSALLLFSFCGAAACVVSTKKRG